MVPAIQSEFIFIQRDTNTMGGAFTGVGKILWVTFLPRSFFRKSKTLSPIVGTLSKMSVNKSGLGLLNPATSENENCPIFKRASTELIQSVTGDVRRLFFQRRSYSGAKGQKLLRTENRG